MKKCLSFLLTVSMLLSMVFASGVTFVFAYNMGDVNRDNVLDTSDVRYALLKIVNEQAFTAVEISLADIDGDGKVSTADVRTILGYVINGTVTEPVPDDVKIIDLLAPTVNDWYHPTYTIGDTDMAVNTTALAEGGYRFMNVGGLWPNVSYAYDKKILVPKSAVIEYDFTVYSDAASINLFLGGSIPEIDDAKSPTILKLNPMISNNVDEAGDLPKGTYKGSVSLSGAILNSSAYEGDKIWISGIKIFVVGDTDSIVKMNKLTVTGYEATVTFPDSTDAYTAVRSRLTLTDEISGFPDLTAIKMYENGYLTNTSSVSYNDDNKKIYQSNLKQRVFDYSDGYRIELPYGYEPDYRLSELRTQYHTSTSVLTISKEEESPYGNTQSGWETYYNEWVARYISNSTYLANNGIDVMREQSYSEYIIPNHSVITFDFAIDEMGGDLDMPYYTIAIIRPFYVYNSFYLLVFKSAVPSTQQADAIISSFRSISIYGVPKNSQGQYEQIIPEHWSEETKAYYNKLCTQNTTDFGFFTESMVSKSDGLYSQADAQIGADKDRISAATGYDYEIMPTYTHLAWYSTYNQFPLDLANKYAGGNGFNGKPVLQFTYQFTINNNMDLSYINPAFDILRGKHDVQFRRLAQDIKKYGKPILFRLNNEMNTDWTSYSGIASLMDPDIFIMTWKHLYNIFLEEGVDNCIWIFNPFDKTFPYSSWSEDLCYMPGSEYVQILGITGYVDGNSSSLTSFQTTYTNIYNKSNPNFANFPWVISEFACGAGGEKAYDYTYNYYYNTTLGRNSYYQAQWVTAMFTCLYYRDYYPFCKNIKGAVWFAENDYVAIDGVNYIVNYFALDGTSSNTLNAFKQGFLYN